MIRHVLKLLWNRRGANALITLEIFFAFLVIFGVTAMAVYHFDHYRQPLGFSWQDVWAVEIHTGDEDLPDMAETGDRIARLLRETRDFPWVVEAAGVSWAPYRRSSWMTEWTVGERKLDHIRLLDATDSLPEVFGIELLAGRWFGPDDDGSHRKPVVVNERLARDLAAGGDPLGILPSEEFSERTTEYEVVGVIRDFRYRGEFAPPGYFAFVRTSLDHLSDLDFLQSLVLRVEPGTPATMEEPLLDRLGAVAPTWSLQIRNLAARRALYLWEQRAPLLVAGLVAAFLLLMVALGLVGVLWQNVTQRTRELGLRRAKGATARRIHRQVLGELLVLTSAAIAAGALVVAQLPITGWFPHAGADVYLTALLIAAAILAVLTALAGLYPSWLATRIQPAEALHYE